MKKGFVFIETIIVITILTVALMSICINYSKIISNTKELNTFDTVEDIYKTYYLKKTLLNDVEDNTCKEYNNIPYSDKNNDPETASVKLYMTVKLCKLKNVFYKLNYLEDETYGEVTYIKYSNIDAYIIDYLNNQDWTENNDNIFLAEFKREDKENPGEYLTYISSLNY